MKKDLCVAFGMLAGLIGALVILMLPLSYMEAKTYNKLTGANVTTWDALWVDLRVTDAPAKK
jgi:hypothetical protein